MVFPNHTPYIEPESVFSALDAMRQGKKLSVDHPLAQFLTIRSHYSVSSDEDITLMQVEIYQHLSQMILAELNHHRSLYAFEPVLLGTGEPTLEQDFTTGNEELQAFSFLYHRFVRVDLNLTMKQFEAMVKTPERTLNRRQELGLFRLTNKLLVLEIRERAEHYKMALRQHLPNAELIFVDRAPETEWAVSQLHDETVQRIMLAGPSGSGKSALAVNLALLTIDSVPLQNVAWINQPAAIPARLIEQIVSTLGLALGGDPRSTLSIYLAQARSLIIIDNAQDIVQAPLVLASILRSLDNSLLILCTRKLPANLPALPTITLRDLDEEAVYSLFDKLSEQYPPMARKFARLDELYNRVGGNPGVLRDEFSAWYGDKQYQQIANRFALVWPMLATSAQLAWITLAIAAENIRWQSQLSSILHHIPMNDVLPPLWENGVITLIAGEDDTEIVLAPLARTYVGLLLDTTDSDLKMLIARAIKRLADYLSIYQDGASCMRMLKSAMRLHVSTSASLDLAHTFVNTIERTGQWNSWIEYLLVLLYKVENVDRLWVLTRLGVAKRQLGHSEEAAYYLTEGLEQAGAQGNFVYQAEMLVELAVLFRSRLNYAATKQFLLQAERLNEHYQQSGLGQRIELENFQLMLAEQGVEELPTLAIKESTPHLIYLTSRVELLQGHYEEALTLAQSLHDQLSKDDPKYPRVVALLGRIHFEKDEWDSAVNETSWAMEAMETRQDVLASIHTKINLALMYLLHQRPDTALKYLQSLPAGYW